jgi:hypothetical protein
MAIHNLFSMLQDSVPEFLTVAEFCINARKPNGGALGYPAAALLFSIVDSIGSYYSGSGQYTISVDGVARLIKTQREHFFVLNSPHFGQSLTAEQIKLLTETFRDPLIHHSVLAPNKKLTINPVQAVFEFTPIAGSRDTFIAVNLVPFLDTTRRALKSFFKEADAVVPQSKAVANLHHKSDRPFTGKDTNSRP